jgi:hypothetical protein
MQCSNVFEIISLSQRERRLRFRPQGVVKMSHERLSHHDHHRIILGNQYRFMIVIIIIFRNSKGKTLLVSYNPTARVEL